MYIKYTEKNTEKKTHNRTHKTHTCQDIIEVGLIIISSHIIIVLNRRLSQRSNWKSKDRPASDIDRSSSKSQSAAPLSSPYRRRVFSHPPLRLHTESSERQTGRALSEGKYKRCVTFSDLSKPSLTVYWFCISA